MSLQYDYNFSIVLTTATTTVSNSLLNSSKDCATIVIVHKQLHETLDH